MKETDYVHHFPGPTQRLARNVEVPDIGLVTCVALDAVDVVRAVWEPLSVEAVLYALQGDDPMTWSSVEVAQPHRLLVTPMSDANVVVSALMADPVVTTEHELSRRVIDSWLESALRDVVAGERQHGEWETIYFSAGRAWVGPVGWRADEVELYLNHEARTVVVPIERTPTGAWLSGPREPAFGQAPLDVELSNMAGRITLKITRNYGYWLDSAEPAAQRLDELINRLRRMGWEDER